MKSPPESKSPVFGLIFRLALLIAAVSLAAYIPYKYATQLHAVTGLYAFLFPLSGLLALAGIVVAVRPESACDCGSTMRAGVGVVSVLWMATGVMCVSGLAKGVMHDPMHGSIAAFHMVAQHVFMSLSLVAFAIWPNQMVRWLGRTVPASAAPLPPPVGRERPA